MKVDQSAHPSRRIVFLCLVALVLSLAASQAVLAGHKLDAPGITCYNCHSVGGASEAVVSGTRLIKKDARITEILQGWSTGNPLPCIYCHDNTPRSIRENMVGVKDHFTDLALSKHPADPYAPADGAAGLDCSDCHTNVTYVGGGNPINPNIHGQDMLGVGYSANTGTIAADDTFVNYTTAASVSPWNSEGNTFCTRQCHDASHTGYAASGVAHSYTFSKVTLDDVDAGGSPAAPTGCLDRQGTDGCHSSHSADNNIGLLSLRKTGGADVQRSDCGVCHSFDDNGASSDWSQRGHGKFSVTNNIRCISCHDPGSAHFETTGSTPASNPSRLAFAVSYSDVSDLTGLPTYANCVSSNCHAGYTAHSGDNNLEVGCLDCHEIHGDGVGSNITMVRETIPVIAGSVVTVVYDTVGAYYSTATPGTFSNKLCDNASCHGQPEGPGDYATAMSTHPGGQVSTGCEGCHKHQPGGAGGGGSWSSSGCDTCHGGDGDNWPRTVSTQIAIRPDRAGAHPKHLAALAGNSSCGACHPNGGHTGDQDNDPADVHQDGISATNFSNFLNTADMNATYDSVGATCSQVDCHGETVTPDWYTATPITCEGCHGSGSMGVPATGLHSLHVDTASASYVNDCNSCHGGSANTGQHGGHWNGSVNYAGSLSGYDVTEATCTNTCHAVSGANDWQAGAALDCADCHAAGYLGLGYPPVDGTVDHDLGRNDGGTLLLSRHEECNTCHGFSQANGATDATGSGGDQYQLSYHKDGKIEMNGDPLGGNTANAGYNSADNGCDNACHNNAPAWQLAGSGKPVQLHKYGAGSCDGCHGGSGLYWPNTAGNDGTITANSAGEHAAHRAALEAQLGYASGTTDDVQQKAMCAYCHEVDPNDGDHTSSTRAEVFATGFVKAIWGSADNATYNSATGVCSDSDCHYNNVTPAWYGTRTADCTLCHNNGTDDGQLANAEPGSGYHTTHVANSTYVPNGCATCHGNSANNPPLDDAAHWNGAPDFANSLTGYPGDGSCTNNCHTGTGSAGAWTTGAIGCTDCHSGSWIGGGANAPVSGLHATSLSAMISTNPHDGSFRDGSGGTASCETCHTSSPSTDHVTGTLAAAEANFAPAVGYTSGVTPTCGPNGGLAGCHDDQGAWQRRWSSTADDTSPANCANCHGDTTAGFTGGVGERHEDPQTKSSHDGCYYCHLYKSGNTSYYALSTDHRDNSLQVNTYFDTTDSLGFVDNGTTVGCSNCHSHNDDANDSFSDGEHEFREVTSGLRSWTRAAIGDSNSYFNCAGCHTTNGATHSGTGESATTHDLHLASAIISGCSDCHFDPGAAGHNNGTVQFGGSYMTTAFNYSTNNFTTTDNSCMNANNGCHTNTADGEWTVGSGALGCGECHGRTGKLADGGGETDLSTAIGPNAGRHDEHMANTAYVTTGCLECHPHQGSLAVIEHVNGALNTSNKVGSYSTSTGDCTNTCHDVVPATFGDWLDANALDCVHCHASGTGYVGDNTGAYLPQSGLHTVTPTVSGERHDESFDSGAGTCSDCHTSIAAQATHVNGTFTGGNGQTAAMGLSTFYTQTADNEGTCAATTCHAGNSDDWAHVWTNTAGYYASATGSCGGCHGDWANGWNTGVIHRTAANVQTKHGDNGTNYECYECHALEHGSYTFTFGGSDWGGASNHGNNVIDVNNNSTSYNSAQGTCDACHSSQQGDGTHNFQDTGWTISGVAGASISVACGECHAGGVSNATTSQTHAAHGLSSATIAADEATCELCHPTLDYTQYAGTHNDTSIDFDNTKVDYNTTTSTCETASCHNSPDNGGDRSTDWDSATKLACDDCHYYSLTPSASGNTLHKASLGAEHGTHFAAGKVCADCHAVPSDAGAENTAHINGATSLTDKATAAQNEAAVIGTALGPQGSDPDPGNPTCDNVGCHDPSNSNNVYAATWVTENSSCTLCHSDTDPGTGSHTAHMTGSLAGTFGLTIACNNCHGTNTIMAHSDGSPTFSDVSYVSNSCGTNACHNNGQNTTPNTSPYTWGTSYGNCTLCHSDSPTSEAHNEHLAHPSYGCADCHRPGTASTHVDGQVSIAGTITYGGNVTVGDGGSYGSCSAGACHDTANDPVWNGWDASEPTCDACHAGSADRDDFNGQDRLASEISSSEWSAAGHGKGGVSKACADCHSSGQPHSFTNPVSGSNPYRLTGSFTCSDSSAGCHNAAPASDVVTHDETELAAAGYSTKRTWTFQPDCLNCHDPHGDGSNLAMVTGQMYDGAAYGTTDSAPSAENTSLVFTSQIGINTSGDSYVDGDAPRSSVCQECHQGAGTTVGFVDGTSANYNGHPGWVSAETDNPGKCTQCHSHSEAFKPSGCANCHGDGSNQFWPNSPSTAATAYENREGAHDEHVAAIGNGNASCGYCHPGNPPAGHPNHTATGSSLAEISQMDTDGNAAADAWTGTYFKRMSGLDDTDAYYDVTTQICSNVNCHGNNDTPDWYFVPDTAGPVFTPNGNVTASTNAHLSAYVTWNPAVDAYPSNPVTYDLYWSTDGTPLTAPDGTMSGIAGTGTVVAFASQSNSVQFQVVAKDAVANTTNSNVSNSVNISAAPGASPPVDRQYYLVRPTTTTTLWSGGNTTIPDSSTSCGSVYNVGASATLPPPARGLFSTTGVNCGSANNSNYTQDDNTNTGWLYHPAFYTDFTYAQDTLVEGHATSQATIAVRANATSDSLRIYFAAVDGAGNHTLSSTYWEGTNLNTGFTPVAMNVDMSGVSMTVPAGSRFAVVFQWNQGSTANNRYRIFFDNVSVGPFSFWVTESSGPVNDTTAPVWSGGVSGIAVTDLATGGALQVSWNTATDAETPPVTYWLYRNTGANNPFGAPDGGWPLLVGSTSYVDSGLTNGTTYYYGVRAENNDPEGKDRTSNTDTASGTPTLSGGGAFDCNSCHFSHPGTGAHDKHADVDTNYVECDNCHGDALSSPGGTAGATTYTTGGPPGSAHNDGSTSMYFPGDDASWDSGTGRCSNVNCHFNNQSPYWYSTGVLNCGSCHGYPPTTGVNHNANLSATDTTGFKTNHDDCKVCHGIKSTSTDGTGPKETHPNYPVTSHANGFITMNGPDSTHGTAAGAEYNEGTGGCENACHDPGGTYVMPSSAMTPDYGDFGGPVCTLCHAAGKSGQVVTASSPHVSLTRGGAFAGCEACHPGNTRGKFHKKDVDANVVAIRNYPAVGVTYGIVVDGTNRGFALGGDSTTGQTEAEICWGCHDMNDDGDLNDANDISEWGINQNAVTGSITYNYGTLDQRNWIGATWTPDFSGFSYKIGLINPDTLANQKRGSIHTANPSSRGGPTANYGDLVGQIRCSYCHDVHNTAGTKGVPGDKDGEPYLRGSWRGNPYPEDGAPRDTFAGASYYPVENNTTNPWGRVPRGGPTNGTLLGGFFIDQNSGDPASAWAATTFGGLCELCHGNGDGTFSAAEINTLNVFGSAGSDWVSGVNGHVNSVKGASHNATNTTGGTNNQGNNIFGGRGGATNQTSSTNSHPYMLFDGTSMPGDASGGFRAPDSQFGYQPPMSPGGRPMDGDGWVGTQWNNLSGRTLDLRGTTINTSFHSFPCSKCHNPHASRLPRLMITNCLDTKHNTWDNQYQVIGNTVDSLAVNRQRSLSNWSSAQNCHRLGGDDPDDARELGAPTTLPGNAGWNTITPW